MNPAPVRIEGIYYDGRQPLGMAAILVLDAGQAMLTADGLSQQHMLESLHVSPRIGKADRHVSFPGGGQLQCADGPALDGLPQETSEGLIAWLEARTAVAVAGIVLIIGTVLAGYFYGLPVAAEAVAQRIPIETERSLGEQALTWLDDQGWLQPSELDEDIQGIIREDFDELRSGLPQAAYLRLEFRNARFFGANAFALPGGTIVVTDDMVKLAESRRELAAVLAHEIGHVERRHTLRHILQNSVVAVGAATLTGDAATLSVAVAGLPALVAQLKYSRDFEREADEFAFRLLRAHGRSPSDFADIMERLAGLEGKSGSKRGAFLSTHPMTEERIQRARDAAR